MFVSSVAFSRSMPSQVVARLQYVHLVFFMEARGGLTVYSADWAYAGYTVYSTGDVHGTYLMDTHGGIVHQWQIPFRQIWKAASGQTCPVPT